MATKRSLRLVLDRFVDYGLWRYIRFSPSFSGVAYTAHALCCKIYCLQFRGLPTCLQNTISCFCCHSHLPSFDCLAPVGFRSFLVFVLVLTSHQPLHVSLPIAVFSPPPTWPPVPLSSPCLTCPFSFLNTYPQPLPFSSSFPSALSSLFLSLLSLFLLPLISVSPISVSPSLPLFAHSHPTAKAKSSPMGETYWLCRCLFIHVSRHYVLQAGSFTAEGWMSH